MHNPHIHIHAHMHDIPVSGLPGALVTRFQVSLLSGLQSTLRSLNVLSTYQVSV